MTERVGDRRRAAAEEALSSSGIPFDPYPGYLTFFVRACVEQGASSGALAWLCRIFGERESDILDVWCRLACGHLWAWREARARLEALVASGEPVPAPLRRFALEPAPSPARGPAPDGSTAVMTEALVRILEDEGLDAREVNLQFGASFPSGDRTDPGTTLRKRRAKGRPYVDVAFGGESACVAPLPAVSRPRVLECDWGDPLEAAVVLLGSGWPAFALIWDFWPEHRDEHIEMWCELAERERWAWHMLRELFDHGVFCGWSLPPLLRSSPSIERPPNPSHRPVHPKRWVRAAVIEARLGQIVRSGTAGRYFVEEALEVVRRRCDVGGSSDPVFSPALLADLGLDVDPSNVRRNFIFGREQLRGLIAYTLP